MVQQKELTFVQDVCVLVELKERYNLYKKASTMMAAFYI